MTFFWTYINTPGTDDSRCWWRKHFILNVVTFTLIDSTLLLFLRLARCLLKGGIAQRLRQSPRTHAPMSVTSTVAEVLLQSWRSPKGFVRLLGRDWAHSLVRARHYHWAHLHSSICYVGSVILLSQLPECLGLRVCGPHTRPGSFNICHLWGRVLHGI